MEVFAEQDNRVRIPDGTAAVCAISALRRKSVTGTSREGRVAVDLSTKHESEDLRNSSFSASCVLWEVRLSQKNGCGVLVFLGAAAKLFLGGFIMKNTTKRLSSLILVLLLALSVLLPGCQKNEPLVIKDSDTYIVIKTTQESLGGKTDMLLIDYMNELSQKGELTCTIADGMITSINGIENPADFSSCWMLYTSDAENANASWGTVEFEGAEYGSAISGAETLKIKPDQLYIWVFKSFT